MVPSQTGDDALSTVPVDEYETVFSFPTVGKNSEMCLTRCRGFWLTFYVDAARCDSGQGPRGNKTKYARSMRAFKARGSRDDPPKVFVSTPPAGLFSHRDIVWQRDVQWPYDKSAKSGLHAVIPAERLLDFRRGVQCATATEFRVFSSYKKGKGTSSAGAMRTKKVHGLPVTVNKAYVCTRNPPMCPRSRQIVSASEKGAGKSTLASLLEKMGYDRLLLCSQQR